MFNKLFKQNFNFDEGSKTNAVEDAQTIIQTIDYIFLRAAVDEYKEIRAKDPYNPPETTIETYAWEGLKLTIQKNGNFKSFGKDNIFYLRALLDGYLMYDDIVHILIDNHDDEESKKHLIQKHPKLLEALPEEYKDEKYVIDVIIEIIRDYQWQLEQFANKHKDSIKKALNILEK